MLKSSFCGGCLGVPLRVGLSAASPRYAVGFPPAIPNVGERAFTVLRLNLGHGLSRPGVRFRPLRQAALAEAGHRGGRTNGTHPSVLSHGASAVRRNFPYPRPARKSSPAFVRQPEADHPPIYFSRPYLLALGNGCSRLSGRLLFPAPGK